MVIYSCEKCGKEFSQKSKYESHKKRKTPCQPEVKEEKEVKKEVKEVKKEEEEDNLKYSKLSYTLTKQISKEDKKNNGIYFTPPKTINENLKFLEPYFKNIKTVLEPSCGSAEFILLMNKQYSDLKITGIEFNKTIYDSIKNLEKDNDNIKLYNMNYLLYDSKEKYDLIIGNPPYFVVQKNEIDDLYYDYFDGRPNIFIVFILKSLKLLNKDGILSFVLPKNFLNCLYYDKTRKYIAENFKILNIIECNDNYIETKQDTIILILQNKMETKENNIYILNNEDYVIFGLPDNIIKLRSLYNDSTTLSKLDFKVNVGNVVWNQCKAILTNDKTKTLLIYSSDIKDNNLNIQTYSNKDKKNYINKKGVTEPVLVINRGYGVGNYKFEYCLIDGSFEYLIENHLICIKYTKSINKKELIKLYNKIIKSLENKKTQEFIELYFGNNAINTIELCEMLPIYDI
jgi:type I restriction-modification system DNA methylase subunit